MTLTNKKIIIYLPDEHSFNENCGGITVQFYFAKILENLGQNIKIYNNRKINNNINNNYFDNNENLDLDNTIVIYGECIEGNPLNAKYVVRWILLDIKRFHINHMLSWGKNDLVYYFNAEEKFNENKKNLNKIYKMLPIIYLNPNIKNNKNIRKGYCHTFRKYRIFHNNITNIHPDDSFEITDLNQENLIEVFNKYEYFVSYDPKTFLSIIASLCGCISIVYPIENINKKKWLESTAFADYLNHTEIYNIPGISYGNNDDEINYAKNTINNSYEEIINAINYVKEKNINNFIKDINNFNYNENTVENNYYV
jgi:hypothetical protein